MRDARRMRQGACATCSNIHTTRRPTPNPDPISSPNIPDPSSQIQSHANGCINYPPTHSPTHKQHIHPHPSQPITNHLVSGPLSAPWLHGRAPP
eukprot:263873-Rhodomonas_salina.4